MVRPGRGVAALIVCVAAWLAIPSSAFAEKGDWKLSSPIFTPKNGTSFTTLFTNHIGLTRAMLLRRYDAVGTLLTSQTITIGANGSLQASPAAHSGAPLHVQIWSEHPGLQMQITYTDSSDVTRRIEWGDMNELGPDYATAASLGSALTDLQGRFGALTSPLDTLQSGVSGLQSSLAAAGGTLDTVSSGVSGANGKLDSIQSELAGTNSRLDRPAAEPPADPRIGALQKGVKQLRKQVKGLRGLLKKALKKRG